MDWFKNAISHLHIVIKNHLIVFLRLCRFKNHGMQHIEETYLEIKIPRDDETSRISMAKEVSAGLVSIRAPPPVPHNLSMTALSARKWAAGFSSSRVSPPPEASRCQNGGWHAATTPDKTEGGPAREPDSAIQWPLDTGANTFGRPSLARPKIVLSWWLSLIIDRVFELLLETSPFLPRTTVEIGDEKWRWREKSKETVRNFRSMVNFEISTCITNFLFSRLQAKWELFILFKWSLLQFFF